LGNKKAAAWVMNTLGELAQLQGDAVEARRLHLESLAIRRALDDRIGVIWCLIDLGQLALTEGDSKAARGPCFEALTIGQEVNDAWGLAAALHALALVDQHEGDWAAAGVRERQSLRLFQQLENRHGVMECLEGLAAVAGARGRAEAAIRYLSVAERLQGEIGTPLPPSGQTKRSEQIERLRAALGNAGFVAAWEATSGLTWEAAAAEALMSNEDGL
jgi:hypothetical protein